MRRPVLNGVDNIIVTELEILNFITVIMSVHANCTDSKSYPLLHLVLIIKMSRRYIDGLKHCRGVRDDFILAFALYVCAPK